MHWIDWVIVIGFIIFLTGMAIYTKRYMKSVAGFLSAERCVGRYLITVALGIAGLGAITIVGLYEMHFRTGFVPKFWELMYLPIALIFSLSG